MNEGLRNDKIQNTMQLLNEGIERWIHHHVDDIIPDRDFGVFNNSPGVFENFPKLENTSSRVESGEIQVQNLNSKFKIDFSETYDILGQRSWTVTRNIKPYESFYGLGDKPMTLDLRGRKLINWGTDTYAYPYAADPLYKNISFYISVNGDQCHGIFINNTYKLSFDFGSENDLLIISAPGGKIDLFFIPGLSPIDIIKKYTNLTGKPEMPPLWALGYHQSKWSYVPEYVLSGIAIELRRQRIPCDCLYLDIDYMNGYRVFTWDDEKFTNPRHLMNSLKQIGFRTVAIIDPGIKIDPEYYIYQEGLENDYFVKTAQGDIYIGPVWPGYCHFPDFTRKDVRNWWADHVAKLYESEIDGVWNDMNEPALFNQDDMIQTQRTFEDDVTMDFDGRPGLFSEGHNIYGMRMSEATFEGAKRISGKRPFVLTRSTYSGGQKFASVWTGDNVASWEHLKIANYQCQMLSISGFSFTGSDVGGFVNEPDGELFTRWLQLAMFHPFYRTHSSKDFGEQEPWSFGDKWTDVARSIIEWRYRLLGYIYSVFQKYSDDGSPMLQPVSLVHWNDNSKKQRFDEFYFGESILVVPVLESKQTGAWVDLPPGDFYHLDSKKHYSGGQMTFVPCPVNSVPGLLKGGQVIPIWPVMQYSGEKPLTDIELWCGYTKGGKFTSGLYIDAFDGDGYESDDYLKVEFAYESQDQLISIHCFQTGAFKSPIKKFHFNMFGIDQSVSKVKVDGSEILFETGNDHLYFIMEGIPESIEVYLKLEIRS